MTKTNNFDLIRLAAALQVALVHLSAHLDVEFRPRWIFTILEMFPGVPVFFFISGFLISKSFEKNPVLKEYALNRALRIYPGLVACFVVSVATVWFTGYFSTTAVSAIDFLAWTVAQLSFLQFYNPGFLRGYGVGVLNGSTWTIAVELQFYVLVPIIYLLLRLRVMSATASNRLLLALILTFLLANQVYVQMLAIHPDSMQSKLMLVSFMPWLYMFLLGIVFQRNFAFLHRWLGGRFVPLLIGYLVLGFVAVHYFDWGFGNTINPLLFAALGATTFAATFSANTLSDKLLRRNDLSYGVYIYHAPVLNFLLAMGVNGKRGLIIALLSTAALAYCSWRWVEKPALHFKRHPFYQHGVVSVRP